MRYALLIYANEQDWANQTEEQSQTQFQEYMAFTKDIVDRGIQQSGEALQPTSTATTVQVRDGETVTTDGPFAETKGRECQLLHRPDSAPRASPSRAHPPAGPSILIGSPAGIPPPCGPTGDAGRTRRNPGDVAIGCRFRPGSFVD
jgi:hypothetical protein